MSRSHDDMMDAHMSGMKWSPDEIGRMQLSNRSTWAAGNARVMNKINGLRADSIVIDEFADFTNLERRITS